MAKQQALYVVPVIGRDQFIWANSAAEARAQVEPRNRVHTNDESAKLTNTATART